MNNTPIAEKLIQDDTYDVEAIGSPAPSRWGRIAVATAGAAAVLSRLAGIAHADDGADDDHDFMLASHKDGAIHDDSDTVKSADSPMTVRSAMTVKSPGTASTAATTGTNTVNSGSVLGTTNTIASPTVTADTTNTVTPGTLTGNSAGSLAAADTDNTNLGLGQLVSRLANGSLSGPQESALATLFNGGLSGSDVHSMKVSEFVHALQAAGLSQDQILSVIGR